MTARLLPLAVLIGCARTGAVPVEAPATPYTVEITVESALSSVDPSSGLPAGLAPLAVTRESRAWRMDAVPTRQHADGSRSTWLRLSGDPALDGRVLALRHFDTGEILSLAGVADVAGPGAGLDVLSLAVAAVSPKVPAVTPKRPGRMITAWPVEVGPGRKVRERTRTEWTWGAREPLAGARTIRVDYAGDWETSGEDAGHAPAIAVAGRGQATGTVWLDVRDYAVVAHDFRWRRTLTLAYPEAREGALELRQTQSFEGRLVRATTPAAAASPPPPRLDPASVPGLLEGAGARLAPCAPAGPFQTVSLVVALHRAGALSVRAVEGAVDDPACFEAALASAPIAPFSGAPVVARFDVLVGEGSVGPPLSVVVDREAPDPLFLHVTGALTAGEHDAVRQALGLAGAAGGAAEAE